ncbi:MAG: hypothetical protein J5959_09710, partial [Butyrivibrio sp.]|nr:hypothetical protein [Butyrivibrio sp.]
MENNNRRHYKGKKARRNRRLVIISAVVAAMAILMVLGISVWLIVGNKNTVDVSSTQDEENEEASTGESGVKEDEISPLFEASELDDLLISNGISSSTIDAIVGAGKEVSKALSLRPETVEMTPENTAE